MATKDKAIDPVVVQRDCSCVFFGNILDMFSFSDALHNCYTKCSYQPPVK